MRLDKFLKVTMLTKRRSVASEAAKEGFVLVNGSSAKASYAVKVGDSIAVETPTRRTVVEVVAVPTANSINKKDVADYISVVESTPLTQ